MGEEMTVSELKQELRDRHQPALASRVGKLSKVRNAEAHLDVGVVRDVARAFEADFVNGIEHGKPQQVMATGPWADVVGSGASDTYDLVKDGCQASSMLTHTGGDYTVEAKVGDTGDFHKQLEQGAWHSGVQLVDGGMSCGGAEAGSRGGSGGHGQGEACVRGQAGSIMKASVHEAFVNSVPCRRRQALQAAGVSQKGWASKAPADIHRLADRLSGAGSDLEPAWKILTTA